MKNFIVLCGPSGSGKTSWALERVNSFEGKIKYVSRDEIRFSLLREGSSYFSKESAVFRKFINELQSGIDDKETDFVIADATHLNEGSRNKLFSNLKRLDKCTIYAVNFFVPKEVCLKRNSRRSGLAKVPETIINEQFKRFRPAKENENEKFSIRVINEVFEPLYER